MFSIILVTRDNLPYTVRCVESLRRHCPKGTELIFVDNGSTDGTCAYLADSAKQIGSDAISIFLDHNAGWCCGIGRPGQRSDCLGRDLP